MCPGEGSYYSGESNERSPRKSGGWPEQVGPCGDAAYPHARYGVWPGRRAGRYTPRLGVLASCRWVGAPAGGALCKLPSAYCGAYLSPHRPWWACGSGGVAGFTTRTSGRGGGYRTRGNRAGSGPGILDGDGSIGGRIGPCHPPWAARRGEPHQGSAGAGEGARWARGGAYGRHPAAGHGGGDRGTGECLPGRRQGQWAHSVGERRRLEAV